MQRQQVLVLFLSFTFLRRTVIGIIDGRLVPDDDMQYMVSVQTDRGDHVCGGVLVSEYLVLTAAQCYDSRPLHVVLGNHSLQNPPKNQRIDVIQKIRHPSFQSVGTGNDLMLLKLTERAVLGNGVNIIQLPNVNTKVKADDVCQVAGWGKTQSRGSAVVDLMATNVSIIDGKTCRTQWGYLPDNVFCAGGHNTNRGFCRGDSGGPLVCNNTAVGIVSFNYRYDCDYSNGYPNVYVDISKYVDWILAVIRFNPIQPNSRCALL